jgi:hypothetical protein
VLAFTPDSLDNASILVCGGGGVALDVTRKLKEAGSWVWQLQRTDVRRCGRLLGDGARQRGQHSTSGRAGSDSCGCFRSAAIQG